MAEKKIEGGAETVAATPSQGIGVSGVEWLKPFSEAPTALYENFYRESFGALARALQVQADFAKRLAECKGPAEALACQLDFLRSASTTCADEAHRGFQSLRSALTPTSRHDIARTGQFRDERGGVGQVPDFDRRAHRLEKARPRILS